MAKKCCPRGSHSRSRSRDLGVVHVTYDRERIEEMRERPEFYRKAADKVNEAACEIVKRGDGWGARKAFLSDVANAVGTPMRRLAPMVTAWNNLGWVSLSRADLVAAMDEKKVADSEVVLGKHASFHFLEVDPKRCAPTTLRGAGRRRRRR